MNACDASDIKVLLYWDYINIIQDKLLKTPTEPTSNTVLITRACKINCGSS